MRPCDCDLCCKMLGCEYTLDQCRPCWLYHHDERYRTRWGGPAVNDAISTAEPERPKSLREWPWLVRVIAKLRAPSDKGIGDTLARNLAKFGTDALKDVYKQLTGRDCGCKDRQDALNQMYPYVG